MAKYRGVAPTKFQFLVSGVESQAVVTNPDSVAHDCISLRNQGCQVCSIGGINDTDIRRRIEDTAQYFPIRANKPLTNTRRRGLTQQNQGKTCVRLHTPRRGGPESNRSPVHVFITSKRMLGETGVRLGFKLNACCGPMLVSWPDRVFMAGVPANMYTRCRGKEIPSSASHVLNVIGFRFWDGCSCEV